MDSILTVTTAATTQDLTIAATVKIELGITGTSEDAKLATWIKQASAMISSYCGRVFGAETVSETFWLDRAVEKLILERFPVSALASVTEDGVVLTTADYQSDPSNGMLGRLSSDVLTCWSARKIIIAYTGGFELLNGLPHDVERACISLVRQLRSQATRDPLAKRIEIPDVRTVDYWVGKVGESGSMPPDVLDLLAPYVNVRI